MPDRQADQEAGDHRAPEAADAAENDDQERRDDHIDADVRAHAPDRHHDDAGEARQRGAEPEDQHPQPGQIDAQRAHHLAVMGAGLDDRAVGRALEEDPDAGDGADGERRGEKL